MLPTARFARIVSKALRVGVPWLLVCLAASIADAAPRSRRHVAPPRCTTTLSLRVLLEEPQTGPGPLAHRGFRLPQGLPHRSTLFQRGSYAQLGDDDAAIQNDAPAAHVDTDDHVTPGLRPLGFLASAVTLISSRSVFSPRSPRGPPSPV